MSSAAKPIASYQDLVDFLQSERVPHELEPATQSAQIPTEQKGVRGVQVIRWQTEDGVIQFIQSMLRDIPEARLPAVESAVARLNHALAWLGLDLNHERFVLAYRLAVPFLPRGAVEGAEIQSGFRAAAKAGAELTPLLARVVAGELAPEAVVAEARKAMIASARASGYPLPVD
jgi:hypothetical protein